MKINLLLSPTKRECSIIPVPVEDASSIHYAIPNISIRRVIESTPSEVLVYEVQ
jgi:hypothetical protein